MTVPPLAPGAARRLGTAALLAAALLAACRPAVPSATLSRAPAIPERVTPAFPDGWRFTPGRAATFGEHGMVSSATRPASDAGVEIMRNGGNAVDAAGAGGHALAGTYPVAGNLGGGGFMVVRLADGRTAAIDYREIAPLAATRNMYLDERGQPTDRSRVGHLASGVPGSVAGMNEVLARYGTKPLAAVIAPAPRLAAPGSAVGSAPRRAPRGGRAARARAPGAGVFPPAA